MSYLEIANWAKYQTYRSDRGTPPWIKVHRTLFTNDKWAGLSDAEKGQLVSIWIAAADNDGKIPANPKVIRKICQLDDIPDINKFIGLGLMASIGCQDDAKMTPTGCQSDAPETETETEAYRGETEKRQSKRQIAIPDGITPPSNWDLFLQFRKEIKKPVTQTQVEGLIRKAEKLAKQSGCDPSDILQQSIDNGYQGIFELKKENSNGNRKQSPLADMRDAWQSVIEESNQRQQDKLGQLRISEGITPASPLRIEADPDLF